MTHPAESAPTPSRKDASAVPPPVAVPNAGASAVPPPAAPVPPPVVAPNAGASAAPPRYRLPAPETETQSVRRENPLHLPLFAHVPSIVHKLLHSRYFAPDDWDRWFDFYALSSRFDITCDLFRNVEYLYVEKELALESGVRPRVLDIGTGRSVFPCYLRRDHACDLVVLDLDDYGFESQRRYFAAESLDAPALVRGDATRPPLADGTFDRLVAVSAIEHFPDDGDIRFLEAAWRLLRPGGLCIVTVPYAPAYQENSGVHHYHGGFERRYNREALERRLWKTGDWELARELYMNLAETPFARKVVRRHGHINHFFDRWYESRSNLRYSHDSLWYTLLLIDPDDKPGDNCFGTCFTLRRPAKT